MKFLFEQPYRRYAAYYRATRYFLSQPPVLLWFAINRLSILPGKRRRCAPRCAALRRVRYPRPEAPRPHAHDYFPMFPIHCAHSLLSLITSAAFLFRPGRPVLFER